MQPGAPAQRGLERPVAETSSSALTAPRDDGRTRARRLLAAVALAVILGGAIAVAAGALGLQLLQITSRSMAPTVDNGEWIVAQDLDPNDLDEVKRGDIVVFSFPFGSAGRAIKRAVALGGDRVEIRARSITVNGKTTPIAGAPGPGSARHRVQTVAPGHLFLLGDNSKRSLDSRAFGPVPAGTVVGRHAATLGPTGSLILKALAAIAVVFAAALVAGLALRRLRDDDSPTRAARPA